MPILRNTGAIPSVALSDIYGGEDNAVIPSPAPSPIQEAGNTAEDTTASRRATYYLLGAIGLLVILRVLYDGAE